MDKPGHPLSGLIVRVEDRLVHGRILCAWVPGWPTEEVWLVSDTIAADPVERGRYQALVDAEENLTGGVITVDEAIHRYHHLSPADPVHRHHVLLVVESCADLERLVAADVIPDETEIGSLCARPDRVMAAPEVFLDHTDLAILKRLTRFGVRACYRPFPGSEPVEISLD